MAGNGPRAWVTQVLYNPAVHQSELSKQDTEKYDSLWFFSTAFPAMMSFDLHIRLCSVDEKMGLRGISDLLKVTHPVTDVETQSWRRLEQSVE